MSLFAFFRDNARWLAVGMLLTAASGPGQTFFISLFAPEIKGAFGLSDGGWGLIYMIGTGASAVAMIWAGRLADRFRVRALGTAVLVLLALACVAMASNRWAWALPAVIFLLRFSGQGMVSHTGVVAMARWFVAARGKALFIAGLGFSLAEAGLPFLVTASLAHVAWEFVWLAAALLTVALIPILRSLTRSERAPQSLGQDEDAAGFDGRHWSRVQALRHWLFWAMAPTVLFPSMFGTALFFQQRHYSAVKGWDHIAFASMVPVYTLTVLAAMAASGLAIDRWGSLRLMPWVMLPMAAAFVLFGLAPDPAWLAPAFVLFGLSQGMNSTLPGAFWAELYGTRHIGAIKAAVAAVMVLGSALGPGLSGWLIDVGIPFPRQLPVIGGLLAVACLWTGLSLRLGLRHQSAPAQRLRR